MSDRILQVENVSVKYGRRPVVHDVSFAIEPGQVYALLGRNGAGKSTLTRAILGLRRADAGRVLLFGQDVWSHRQSLMARIGVVPEDNDAPGEMTVAQLERFFASLYPRWNREAVYAALDRFRIAAATRVRNLSKGQSKQVSLALALASQPELLILDDPTLGLDAVARKSLFEEVITDLADRGTTVLMTTHDLAGVESIASRVGILRNGSLVLDEDVESLKARFRRIRYAGDRGRLEQASLAAASVRSWGTATEAVVTNYTISSEVEAAEVLPLTLEEIFIAVTGEDGGAA